MTNNSCQGHQNISAINHNWKAVLKILNININNNLKSKIANSKDYLELRTFLSLLYNSHLNKKEYLRKNILIPTLKNILFKIEKEGVKCSIGKEITTLDKNIKSIQNLIKKESINEGSSNALLRLLAIDDFIERNSKRLGITKEKQKTAIIYALFSENHKGHNKNNLKIDKILSESLKLGDKNITSKFISYKDELARNFAKEICKTDNNGNLLNDKGNYIIDQNKIDEIFRQYRSKVEYQNNNYSFNTYHTNISAEISIDYNITDSNISAKSLALRNNSQKSTSSSNRFVKVFIDSTKSFKEILNNFNPFKRQYNRINNKTESNDIPNSGSENNLKFYKEKSISSQWSYNEDDSVNNKSKLDSIYDSMNYLRDKKNIQVTSVKQIVIGKEGTKYTTL